MSDIETVTITKVIVRRAGKNKYACPKCSKELRPRGKVDSDERVYGKFLKCVCGFDSRKHHLFFMDKE